PYFTLISFFFNSSRPHPDLHSFPTRRSSDLINVSGMAEQLMATNGPLARGESRCSVRATISLPEPVSPVINTDAELGAAISTMRSEEHTSELQSRFDLVCRLLLEKKKKNHK